MGSHQMTINRFESPLHVQIDQTTPGTTNAVQIVNPCALFTATIANGQSLSGAIAIGNDVLVGLVMPAVWTAADLTLDSSADGATYNNVYDRYGTEYTLLVDASRFIPLNPVDFAAMPYLKIRSGTAGAPVNQGGDRIITLVTRPM